MSDNDITYVVGIEDLEKWEIFDIYSRKDGGLMIEFTTDPDYVEPACIRYMISKTELDSIKPEIFQLYLEEIIQRQLTRFRKLYNKQ